MGVKTRNLGNSEGKDIQWQQPLNADGSTIFNLEAGKGYFINTTGGVVELKLPTGSLGDRIAIVDFAGTFNTNKIRLNLNGQKLNGSTNPSGAAGQENYVAIDTDNARLELVFSDSDKGWVVFESEAKTSPTGAPFGTYISATGGTVTTSGDFKIHTFTGDGNFIVSSVGNSAGGGAVVDYLVVAGGGGASGCAPGDTRGGAGAGGFRYSASTYTSPSCAPGHPLRATCGITVTATTFPVTVGAGGAGACHPSSGNRGSNSVFSTITSTGGGSSNAPGSPTSASAPGGSGGGNPGGGGQNPGAAGNTPPVSPAQGTNGGANSCGPDHAGGGGGGAIQAGGTGGNSRPGPAGVGGAGAGIPNAFGCNGESSGGFRVYAGGGGGAGSSPSSVTGGAGGVGGGGCGVGPSPSGDEAGAANTGGGGGGGGPGSQGGTGGKGIVVIRYRIAGTA